MNRWLAILLSLFVMAACAGEHEMELTIEELGVLSVGRDRVIGIAVSDDGSVIISARGDSNSGTSATLALLADKSDDLSRLGLSDRDACGATEYFWPQRIADGRIAAVRKHAANCGDDELVAIDLETLEVEGLADASEPVAAYAWDTELRRAVVESGSDLCAGLGSLEPGTEIQALSLEVVGEGRAFAMVDAWISAGGEGCETTGWARWPSINVQGQLAFFASADASGVAGPDRALGPARLYITGPGASEATPSGPTVVEPRALSWSPDDQSLAFAGTIDGVEGTWVWSSNDARATRVFEQAADWLAWVPGSDALVVVVGVDPSNPLSEAKLVRLSWEEGGGS